MKGTLLSALAFLAGVYALGQETAGRDIVRNLGPGSVAASPRTFGTTGDSLQRVGLQDFTPAASTFGYGFTDGTTTLLRYSTTAGPAAFLAHPHLPSGALLSGVEFDVCDIDPVNNLDVRVCRPTIWAALFRSSFPPQSRRVRPDAPRSSSI